MKKDMYELYRRKSGDQEIRWSGKVFGICFLEEGWNEMNPNTGIILLILEI
jgi:hypothetical protein